MSYLLDVVLPVSAPSAVNWGRASRWDNRGRPGAIGGGSLTNDVRVRLERADHAWAIPKTPYDELLADAVEIIIDPGIGRNVEPV